MKRVYLDYAATSPLRPEVLDAMLPWMTGEYGNANALYSEGKVARRALDNAREKIASLIGASPTELVFTSGGTESNNALIAGIVLAVRQKKGIDKGGNHIVRSAFEHHAVGRPVIALKRNGYETSSVKPSRDGFIKVDSFAGTLRNDTVLATVLMAQNEIGTIQPISELAEIAHSRGVLFHTDAVQALGKVAFDVRDLDIDSASFSAHKLGGPKGVGAFYLKRLTPFTATQLGGRQEGDRRSGTQNVAGAVGFATALELACKEREQETKRLTALRDRLAIGLKSLGKGISLTIDITPAATPTHPSTISETPSVTVASAGIHNNDPDNTQTPAHLPHMLSFVVPGHESETMILKLDDAGFAVSGGSACSSASLDPSHVLSAIGVPRDEAYSVLRVSLGRENTCEDVDSFLAALAKLI